MSGFRLKYNVKNEGGEMKRKLSDKERGIIRKTALCITTAVVVFFCGMSGRA